jgi:hypothetical protein
MGRIEVCTGCWWVSLRERGHWGGQDVDGRIILRWIFRKRDGVGMDLIDLSEDRDRWRALLNSAMNLRVPYNAGNFLTS